MMQGYMVTMPYMVVLRGVATSVLVCFAQNPYVLKLNNPRLFEEIDNGFVYMTGYGFDEDEYGYEDEAEQIQDFYLSGQKDSAEAAVPDEFLKATAMVGDEGWVRDRIMAYKESGVTRLSINPVGPDRLETIEKVKGWIS